jgi:uncharacterized membrane protein YedE/YeeE
MPLAVRLPIAALVVVALGAGYWMLSGMGPEGRPLAFALLAGSAFGLVLQRSRFCFYCNLRDLIDRRESAGVIAILVALAIGAIGYMTIFGAWLPTPSPDRLPPTAHVGPVSVVLVGASFVFGLGMAVSGSCLSAHFYRLGEGSVIAPFAIAGAAAGFGLGFMTWNPLFELATSDAVVVWFPHHLGYTGSLALTLLGIAALALLALWWGAPQPRPAQPALDLREALANVFVRRWSGVVGGGLVGIIATLYYFRVAPLGVTAELGSLVRTAGTNLDLLPSRLYGLDLLRGCATVVKDALLSNNGLFVIGLVAAAFASALVADQFKPRRLTLNDVVRGLGGGLLLGWGAMTALGCTVGVLLSGIHAGSLSGWVFLLFCGLGAALGILAARAINRRAAASRA